MNDYIFNLMNATEISPPSCVTASVTPGLIQPARLSALTREDVARAAQGFGETPLSIIVAGQPIGL